MTPWLTALAWIATLAAGFPLAVLSIELLAGLLPTRRIHRPVREGQIAVLIPAHDETNGIASTIADLRSVAPPETDIIVVADNCSDDTAGIARAAGAQVIERTDAEHRGKGYALAFGRDWLASRTSGPPDVVIVLDADCRLIRGSLEQLADRALSLKVPAQAVNLIEGDLHAAPMVQISSFAMVVKNLFRSRGMQRLGGPALLTGTGMAFPWSLFADAGLATGSIVEDLSLGIELTRRGHAPYLVETAHVRSAPADMRDALQQRKRWEHGFLDTLRRFALPVLLQGLRRGSRAETLLGLHLMVPPLALTLLMALAALAFAALLSWLGASITPASLLGMLLACSAGLILIAWLARGRPFLSASTLARIPLYILWKLPIYASFLKKPQASWTRTPRRKRENKDV